MHPQDEAVWSDLTVLMTPMVARLAAFDPGSAALPALVDDLDALGEALVRLQIRLKAVDDKPLIGGLMLIVHAMADAIDGSDMPLAGRYAKRIVRAAGEVPHSSSGGA